MGGDRTHWYGRGWLVIAALVLFFPIGLWIMWRRRPGWDRLTNLIVTAMVLAVAVVGLAAGTTLISPKTSVVSRSTASPSAPAATSTASPSPAQTPTSTPTPTSWTSIAAPTQNPPPAHSAPPTSARCGAPSNPWGYTLCGGELIHDPPTSFCSYFSCISAWGSTSGYVIECSNGTYSRVEGPGACPAKQPLYGPQGSANPGL